MLAIILTGVEIDCLLAVPLTGVKDMLPVGWSIDCSMKWCLVNCIINGSTDHLPVGWNIH